MCQTDGIRGPVLHSCVHVTSQCGPRPPQSVPSALRRWARHMTHFGQQNVSRARPARAPGTTPPGECAWACLGDARDRQVPEVSFCFRQQAAVPRRVSEVTHQQGGPQMREGAHESSHARCRSAVGLSKCPLRGPEALRLLVTQHWPGSHQRPDRPSNPTDAPAVL